MDAVEPLLEDQLSGGADAVLRVSRRQRARTSPSRPKPCRRLRAGARRPRISRGPRISRIASGSGRRATTRIRGAGAAARRARRGRRTCACRSRAWPSASSRPRRDQRRRAVSDLPGRPRGRRQLPPDLRARSGRARRSSAEARRLNERMVARALAMGGTCTGEHGVGLRQDEVPRGRARARRSRSCGRSSARSIRQSDESGEDDLRRGWGPRELAASPSVRG